MWRDGIGADSSLYDPYIECRISLRVGEGIEGQKLMGSLLIGIGSLPVVVACMLGDPLDLYREESDTFASDNDLIAGAGCFKYHTVVIVWCQRLGKILAVSTASLLITDQQHIDIAYFAITSMMPAQCLESDKITPFHIADPRAVDPGIIFTEPLEGTGGKYGIKMAKQEQLFASCMSGTKEEMISYMLSMVALQLHTERLYPLCEYGRGFVYAVFVGCIGVDLYDLFEFLIVHKVF